MELRSLLRRSWLRGGKKRGRGASPLEREGKKLGVQRPRDPQQCNKGGKKKGNVSLSWGKERETNSGPAPLLPGFFGREKKGGLPFSYGRRGGKRKTQDVGRSFVEGPAWVVTRGRRILASGHREEGGRIARIWRATGSLP